MNIAVDFHIHSGLSPCAEEDMTPNNIINLAVLKGLDAIAITDHNSTKNLNAFLKVAQSKGLICIPGVEVTTKEEVHLLALFKNQDQSNIFQNLLDTLLPEVENKVELFGHQFLYDVRDHIIGEHPFLLLNAIHLSLEETIQHIRRIGGIAIPAHIDRDSFSILSNLGFIGPELGFTTVEVSRYCDLNKLKKEHPYLEHYHIIRSSDAHYLGDILEREFFIEIEEFTIDAIFEALNKPV